MKNTKKIILGSSLFFALGASPALAETLWANDVSFSDGWTDITQAGDTCGPTTATNMIYWWLGQAKKDYVLPDSVNKSIGDLWKEVSNNGWRKDYTYNALCDFSKEYNLGFVDTIDVSYPGYYVTNSATGGCDPETYRAISDFLKSSFEKGGVCAITNANKIPHAMTCYGAVFDSDGLVTTLYMADSAYTSPKDKLETYTYDPKEYCFRTQVKNSDGSVSSAVFSIDYIDALWYDKDAVTGLALIPEPSAFGLLAGLGALACVASRRKNTRKR